ncbi:hypothetical protein FORC066_4312 [Yersinia enterocolitica]|nr:hypothetical protein FORC066_4312 [Yersinia enterocolitica]
MCKFMPQYSIANSCAMAHRIPSHSGQKLQSAPFYNTMIYNVMIYNVMNYKLMIYNSRYIEPRDAVR